MSKSYGNSIFLKDTEAEIRSKLKTMVTDPARQRRTDKGDPAKCPVFDLHKAFSTRETRDWATAGCTSASIGCIECKSKLSDHVVARVEPMRQKREELSGRPDTVMDILREGSARARTVARATMQDVHQAMKIAY
jgi:tryptophanyl-tRNA synthetase